MLEFSADSPRLLQSVVDAVSQVCQEANLDCSESGLALSGMDSGHVSLAKLELKSEFFSKYRCDAACSLGLHFGTLLKVIKFADRSEQISFLHKEHSDELTMKKCRLNSDLRPATYLIKLINLDCERLDITPNKDYVRLEVSSTMLKKIIQDMTFFGEDIKFEIPYKANQKERYVIISAAGDAGQGEQIIRDGCYSTSVDVKKDPDYASSEDDQQEDDKVQIEEVSQNGDDDEEDVKPAVKHRKKSAPKAAEKASQQQADEEDDDGARELIETSITYGKDFTNKKNSSGIKIAFAAQYLNTFLKAASLSRKVVLSIAPENPIELEFQVNDFGKLCFYLAPRYHDDSAAVKDEY